MLLNLLIVLCGHNDHLAVSSILMNNKTEQLNFGLVVPHLPVLQQNFTEVGLAALDEDEEDEEHNEEDLGGGEDSQNSGGVSEDGI